MIESFIVVTFIAFCCNFQEVHYFAVCIDLRKLRTQNDIKALRIQSKKNDSSKFFVCFFCYPPCNDNE